MQSHEQYCEELKRQVLRYTDQELNEGFKQTNSKNNCKDYAAIFKIEIDNRKP
jgi:hypothetical protein